ncbi:YjcZ family sporulation protein [Paenibacillus sp. NRS-1775]
MGEMERGFGGVWTSIAAILTLFILLVIILKTFLL